MLIARRNLLLLLVCLVCASCAYPVRNQPASAIGDSHGYQFHKLQPNPAHDTLVILTLSGGGTRATALGLSVLRGLEQVQLPDGQTLADEIDIVSSVSGGSVTAAYFAAAGRKGFQQLEEKFIRQDGMSPLLWGFFNPFGLIEYSTAKRERIDLLIDYLNKQLFDKQTYQTLIDHGTRPFLILNAADMVEGTPFPFTQRKMDLLCSDLSQLPLATAVAASAAFPVALSPVTLKNYSRCPAQKAPWPPLWVQAAVDLPDTPSRDTQWYANPPRVALGRAEYAYAVGNRPGRNFNKLYIHLLDGGIADNLGVLEPYRMLTAGNTQPDLLQQINTGKVKKLIFIVVNARSFSASGLDQTQATPDALDMLLASIDSPIDRATTGTASQLRELLFDEFRQIVLRDPSKAEIFHALAKNTALVTVDFDAILDEDCRRKYHNIPTRWALEKKQIDALMEVGKALLQNDPEFDNLLSITGGSVKTALPSLESTCQMATWK